MMTLWYLYQIRWYSYIFAFLQLEVKQHPQKLPFKFSLFMLQSPVKTVWRCSASPFSVPLPNWMLLIRDTNFRSKWWCKRRLIRLVSTFTTLVSAVLHCPMFRLFKHRLRGNSAVQAHCMHATSMVVQVCRFCKQPPVCTQHLCLQAPPFCLQCQAPKVFKQIHKGA